MQDKKIINCFIFLSIFLFKSKTQSAEPCVTPANIGHSYTLIQMYDEISKFQWEISGNQTLKVASCAKSLFLRLLCITFVDGYQVNGDLLDNDQYRMTFTILRVTRAIKGTTIHWEYQGKWLRKPGSCDLEIYSIESDPVCTTIQVSNTVLWSCDISQVYPRPLCRFYYKKDNETYESVPSKYVLNGDPRQSGNPVFYSRTCAMNATLLPGAYKFKVTMQPDVKGTLPPESIKSVETEANLVLPVAVIKNCPSGGVVKNGYIKEGTTATCECHLTEVGSPPGTPQWLNSIGGQVGQDIGGGTRSLSLTYSPYDPKPSYTCRGSSQLGQSNNVSFTPKFAYGPRHAQIKISKETFVFCDVTSTFDVFCDIPTRGTHPKPRIALEGGDAVNIRFVNNSDVSEIYYRYRFSVRPTVGGILTLKCVVSSSIFPDISVRINGSVSIQAPPSSRPIMLVDNKPSVVNGGVQKVTNGQTAVVKCLVEGGYPPVSEVTAMCVGLHNVSRGVESTQTLLVDEHMNGKTCACSAVHRTGCYDKSTQVTLDIQYLPNLMAYTVNYQSQDPEVMDGDDVSFSCQADGNPMPDLSIRRKRSNKTISRSDLNSIDYVTISEITRVMGCKDTDTYICRADNGVGDGVEKSLSVFVKCVPELQSPETNPAIKEFTPTNDARLTITIDIIAYPNPQTYTLFMMGNRSNINRKRELDKNKYTVTYTAGMPPEGTVVLQMFDLHNEDSGQYLLNINNSIGDGLEYRFHVLTKSGSSSMKTESIHTGLLFGIGIAVGCGKVWYI